MAAPDNGRGGARNRSGPRLSRRGAAREAAKRERGGREDESSSSREQLQLSRRLFGAQETERQRIARELHDDIGQALLAVKINLQSIRRIAGASAIASEIQESIDSVDQAVRRVRDLSVALRPSLLDELGLVPALRWYVDRQAQRGGFRSTFEADEPMNLPAEVETACFRIAQEALTNVLRHSNARHVNVVLRLTDGVLYLSIADDGRGFDVPAAVRRVGADVSLGLLGMRERARLLGGRVTVESVIRKGTTVRAQLPRNGSPTP